MATRLLSVVLLVESRLFVAWEQAFYHRDSHGPSTKKVLRKHSCIGLLSWLILASSVFPALLVVVDNDHSDIIKLDI
jgi:RsiW-degrading membrane proteinase PrsW (M82 family)